MTEDVRRYHRPDGSTPTEGICSSQQSLGNSAQQPDASSVEKNTRLRITSVSVSSDIRHLPHVLHRCEVRGAKNLSTAPTNLPKKPGKPFHGPRRREILRPARAKLMPLRRLSTATCRFTSGVMKDPWAGISVQSLENSNVHIL